MATKKEWTVFFLAKSIGSADTKSLIRLLRKIEGITFEPYVGIVMCINFSRLYLDALINLDESMVCQNIETNFTTMFFRFDQDPKIKKNRLCCIGEKEDFDITHPDDVSEFFKKHILEKNEAEKYLLFTWDHGNGFDIFYGIGQGGQSNDSEKSVAILEMSELAQAIKMAFDNKKIDLLIMMNCYMQMFDTGFTLCEQVDYIVAPQSFMVFEDYDYEYIFKELAERAKEGVSGAEMGKIVINSFEKRPPLASLSISCVNLSSSYDFYEFANDLDELAELLLERIKKGDYKEVLCFFKETISVSSQHRFIDLGSLLENIKKLSCPNNGQGTFVLNSEEVKSVDKLLDQIKKLIVAYFNKYGNDFQISYDGYQGITIVSPVPTEVHEKAADKNELEVHLWNSIFMNSRRWGELIYVLDILDY